MFDEYNINNIELYNSIVKNKYSDQLEVSSKYIENTSKNSYFKTWLVGFIEIKGIFVEKHLYFKLEHNDEFLIKDIRKFFSIGTKIKISKSKLYKLEVHKINTLKKISLFFLFNEFKGHQYNNFIPFFKSLFEILK